MIPTPTPPSEAKQLRPSSRPNSFTSQGIHSSLNTADSTLPANPKQAMKRPATPAPKLSASAQALHPSIASLNIHSDSSDDEAAADEKNINDSVAPPKAPRFEPTLHQSQIASKPSIPQTPNPFNLLQVEEKIYGSLTNFNAEKSKNPQKTAAPKTILSTIFESTLTPHPQDTNQTKEPISELNSFTL